MDRCVQSFQTRFMPMAWPGCFRFLGIDIGVQVGLNHGVWGKMKHKILWSLPHTDKRYSSYRLSGVLFLDELPEFGRSTIEVLRQPLEDKEITIDRIASQCTYPADFMLVAAMNPCKCGYFPNHDKCSCNPIQVRQYRSKISQPLLDRIDICIEIQPVGFQEWFADSKEENSEQIRERVTKARKIQSVRYCDRSYRTNSGLTVSDIAKYCILGTKETELMKQTFNRLELSGRGYHRILKVARTIADLDNSDQIKEAHLREAICYRSMEVR